MGFFEFLGYCFSCMFSCFSAMFGYAPSGFSINEILIGTATFLVVLALIFLFLWLTGIIKLKKKGE